ncbi:MAG: substrate-binding domain-containing protein, partial [Aeromicrobium sp.]
MKMFRIAGLLAAGALVLTACSGTGSDDNKADDTKLDYTYSVITHAGAGDAFWDRVKSGAERAGKDYGVKVEYNGDADPAKQSQLIDNAVAQKVNGIVVSMANPDGLETSIKKAVAAGIPVVTINSGIERYKEFGAITHVGQSEQIAGEAVGERLKEEGLKNVLCVIHEAGNVGLETRCKAAADKAGGKVTNIQVDGTNDAEVKSTLKSKLQSDKSIDGVLTLGGQFALDAMG